MDLLDPVGQEGGDQAQADRLGLLKSEGGEAPALLLARMPTPGYALTIPFAADQTLGEAPRRGCRHSGVSAHPEPVQVRPGSCWHRA